MGLDMYAWATNADVGTVQVDFCVTGEGGVVIDGVERARATPNFVREQLMYWRKHPNLHKWMEDLYFAKGGRARSFNCTPVRLLADDLDRLEGVVRSRALPHGEGFFWGQSYGTPEERQQDLQFIERARQALREGKLVYYDSWW